MIIVNTETIPGKTIKETLGVVRGNAIRARHIGKDIIVNLRTIIGGEMKEYTEMLTEARQIATQRMVDQAIELGADAIINLRYSTSMVMDGSAEILAYGTAVKLEDEIEKSEN